MMACKEAFPARSISCSLSASSLRYTSSCSSSSSSSNRLLVHASSSISSSLSSIAVHHLSRRSILVPVIALPLLLHMQNNDSFSAEDFADPAEQALVETLDARDSLTMLCEDLKSFTEQTVSTADLQNPRRTLGEIYESLEASLPKVAEQFDFEEDIVQELLESVACAQDVFIRSCFTTNPSSGLYNCSKFLELACVQMDEMLEQVPIKTLQAMQLLRGIRPIA